MQQLISSATVDQGTWNVNVKSPVQVLQGMTATFNCSFEHPYQGIRSSNIAAMWLKYPCENTSPILYSNDRPNNDGVTFIGNLETKNCSLQINDVRINHTETYCFRFEIKDKDQWTGRPGVTLTVKARPSKPIISLSSELVDGVKTKLTCTSSEIDEQVNFILVWHYLNGEFLKKHRSTLENRKLNSNLDFTPSFRDHNKSIKCSVVSRVYSFEDETVKILKVKYAPKNITIQVNSRSRQEIKEYDWVSLTCASNSNPEATYTWTKREKSFNTKNGTLVFESISPSDSGIYHCTAKNYLGNQSSEAVEIRVQYAPKNVRIQLGGGSQLEIMEGDKVSLTCVSNSNPIATHTWYKRDERKIETFNSKNGTLLFQNISPSASGFYSCMATNYLGNQSSEAVEIRVQYAPKNITTHMEGKSKMEIKEGDDISFVCTSQSYPDANHSWYKKKEDDDQIMALNSTKGTLLLHNISRRDSGLYICTASNYLGNKTSEDWQITVYFKPSQINLTQDGMSFHCITEANPPAMISWNSTGTVTEVHNDTWTISTLIFQTMASGCVSCQAQNRFGFINSEEQCFKSTQGALVLIVIVGSFAAILLLLGIFLWIQKKYMIRGKKMEDDSQCVIHTEMQNLPEINQTNNSDVVYENLLTSEHDERKLTFSKKHSGNALVYASLRFPYVNKIKKAARSNSIQAKPRDAQVTASADVALYDNIPLFKTINTELGAACHDPEETTHYACINVDNLKGQTASKIKQ
ncbi:sialic acid-binding Ig-like lectin 10 isoform X2 [Narcine bancroftii]|uniref:sialic acid-binding Ig-like lectin 10 isoform X2 n=1 Tax=Narcine bancroftii TaxID=1343680 RepID=UPI0038310616